MAYTGPLNPLPILYGGVPAEAVIRGMYYPGTIQRRYDLRFPLDVLVHAPLAALLVARRRRDSLTARLARLGARFVACQRWLGQLRRLESMVAPLDFRLSGVFGLGAAVAGKCRRAWLANPCKNGP